MKLSSMVTPRLLASRVFDIEFHGYLSNHAKHGIIALDRIDAPEHRIQEWWNEYTSVTPYNLRLHKVDKEWDSVKPCSPREWNEWRGKKVQWQEMCRFMQKELLERFEGDTKKLIREYAPPLLPGMAGALTHGIIHLGWAIDADSEWMVIEGLAYLNFCYIGIDPSNIVVGPNDEGPVDSFLRIAETWEKEDLAITWVEPVKAKYGKNFHPELVPAGFQWELSKLLEEPHPVAVHVPKWLEETPVKKLWEDLYRAIVLVYLATRDKESNGNFVILHGITSLWGLEHVLQVIGDESVTRKALQQYYAMVLCLLATSSSGFPSTKTLQEVSQHFVAPSEPDWKQIEERGMAEAEEHNIKLVYVCRELWKRFGKWSGFSEAAGSFTLTPNIGPSESLFKA